MDNGPTMTNPGSGISLTWLLRLRWITVVSQAVAILAARHLDHHFRQFGV